MVRLLFWVLLGVIVYAVAKSRLRPGAGRARRADEPSEPMVRCSACGLNVPQTDAHPRDGLWYCSREHLERGRAGH